MAFDDDSGDATAGLGSLRVSGLVKHFGHVRANDGIDIEFAPYEIHALLGENGAGKSTLIKILAGVYRPDQGRIQVDGSDVVIDSPMRSRDLGIAVVHQHSTLVPQLTVFENVTIREAGLGRLDRSLSRRLVDSGRRLGFDIDPRVRVENLTPGDRQRVEIARALMTRARFVILDEPSAVLTPAEREGFFDLLRRLAGEGVAVIFVTHHLKEALQNSHRMTVLRLGRVVARSDDPASFSESKLVRLMVGEVEFRGKLASGEIGDEVVRVIGLTGTLPGGLTLREVSFSVRAGEVLGIAGVEGNGQRELAAALTGAWSAQSGSVEIDCRPLLDYKPAERSRLVADVPDDHALATIDTLTVWENLGIAKMAWASAPTPRMKRHVRVLARKAVAEFSIRTPSVEAPVFQLSGGNRRRVVLARELGKKPRVVVASFATKGLDIRSQEQIKQWTRRLAREGAAVIYIASDLEEILEVCDRIAVMARGRITGIVNASNADVQLIGKLMLVEQEETAS